MFKTFQNMAFSPSWACIIVLYHVFFLACVFVLPRLQIWLYDLAQKGQIACMYVNLCVFFAQSLSARASGK